VSVGDAFLAALRLAVPGRQVWDGQPRPEADESDYDSVDPSGYVAAYIPTGDRMWVTVGGPPTARDIVLRTHSFGPSRSAAEWLSDKVVDYVTTHGIDIPGWGTAFVLDDETGHTSQPPVTDDDVPGEPLVRIYDEFHFLIAVTT
jgi:hypothetical protein